MNTLNTKHSYNSAMIGMILFDGSMQNDHMLYLRHGGNQLDYVDNKVLLVSKYLKPKTVKTSIDKKGYAYRYAYFNDRSLKYLYDSIYIDGKKRLSKSVLNRFTPLTLAIMYMDDGCLVLRKDQKQDKLAYKSREIYLATHSFSVEEVTMLQNMLLDKFGVEFRMSFDKGKPRLWCNTKNTIKFLTIVAPIVKRFPSMHYKLDLKYESKKVSFL